MTDIIVYPDNDYEIYRNRKIGGGGGAAAGDIISSVRPLTPPVHLLCNGMLYENASYPQLAGICFPAIGVKYDAVSARPEAGTIHQFAVGASTIMAIGDTTLWRSTDGGSTWADVAGQAGYGSMNGAACDGTGKWILYPTYSAMLRRSIDNGATWESIPVLAPFADGLRPFGYYNGVWMAFTNLGVVASNDFGESWHLAIGLQGALNGGTLVVDASGNSYYLSANGEGGLYKSTPDASKFAVPNNFTELTAKQYIVTGET